MMCVCRINNKYYIHYITLSSDGQTTSVCNQPPRPTQSPTLCGMVNEYQPKCHDTLWLGSKGRRGSFNMWINIHAAGKTKWSLVNTWQLEHFGDEYCTHYKAACKCTAYFTYLISLHWSQQGQIIHCHQSFFFVEHQTPEARRETVISSAYYDTKYKRHLDNEVEFLHVRPFGAQQLVGYSLHCAHLHVFQFLADLSSLHTDLNTHTHTHSDIHTFDTLAASKTNNSTQWAKWFLKSNIRYS